MNLIREQEQSVTQYKANGPQTNTTEYYVLAAQTEGLPQSQHMVIEDKVIERTNSDAETSLNGDNFKASKDSGMKKESTSFDQIRSFLKSSNKSNSSMHGNLYHVHVALISCLRLFESFHQGEQDDFIVSVEVAVAGKFDDIMVYTPSGTWFMQLKHKKAKCNITENGLFEASGDLSITTYFESYLEVDKELQEKYLRPWYALCTNSSDTVIKDPKKGLLTNYKKRDAAVEEAFKDINGTCYQFDPNILIEKMEVPCIDKLAEIIAKKVTNCRSKTDIMSFDNGLLNIFASLIQEFLQPLEDESSDPSVLIYSIKQKDGNADVSTSIGKLQAAFTKKYELEKRKLNQDSNGTQPLKIIIDKESFNAAASTEWGEKFKDKLGEFCQKFVLVANTSNEVTIRKEAKTKFTRCCKVKLDLILAKIKETLFEALKNPVPIDRKVLKQIFKEIEVIAPLMSESREYLDSLKRKFPHIELQPECLKQSQLNAFVTNDQSIHEFSCSLDLDVSMRIIDQTLSLHQYETLVLNSAKHQETRYVLDILEDLLCYLRDVDHQTIKVIAILGQLEDGNLCKIKELCEQYSRKVVIVSTAITANAKTDQFFVRDLLDKAKEELYLEHEQQIILETVTPLSRIIREEDDLGLFLNMLKISQQPEQLQRYDSIEQHFMDIEPWYIDRRFVPVYTPQQESSIGELFRSSSELDRSSHQETVLISDVAKSIRYGSHLMLSFKEFLESSDEETKHPPGLEEDENHNKVAIFLDDAGSGKTTYFTWLAWHLTTYDPSLYVIKLIALEYSTDFERLEESGIEDWSDDQMVRFLYRLIHLTLFVPNVCRRTIEETDVHREEADRCAEALSLSNGQIALDNSKTKELTTKQVIVLRLFREKFNRKQLILILDGFDEIAPNYKDVVMKCFARFSFFEGVRNVYLSSRPYDLDKELKKTFPNCQMYRLGRFFSLEVCSFLYKRLALNIDAYKQCREDEQLNFLLVLLVIITRVLKDSVTVPLLLDMAFVTLLPAIREHVNFKANTMSGSILNSSNLDILQVVEKFVDRKLEILLTDKSGTTNASASTPAAKKREKEEKKRIQELHMLLAICTLFDSDDSAKLLSIQEQQSAAKMLKEVEEAEEKTGIICGVQGGRPQFVHRLFAEYFVACWLHQNWKRFKQESVFQSQVIYTYSMEEVRRFFNRMIVRESEGCELHQAVLDGRQDLIKEIIRKIPSTVTVKDKVGRSPLHIDLFGPHIKATYRYEFDFLKHILQEIINHRDGLYGWNVLEYAFALNEFNVVKGLLEHKAELNVDILMQQLTSNDTYNLIKQANEYVGELYDCGQLETANELSALIVELLINEKGLDIFAPHKKLDGLSVFEWCASRNDGCMFFQFVKQIGTSLVQALPAALCDRLFQKAFEKRVYKVVNNLMNSVAFPCHR